MLPDTDDNLAYQGFTFLLCLLLLPVGFCFFFRGPFSAERLLPRFGTAGRPLSYRVLGGEQLWVSRVYSPARRLKLGIWSFPITLPNSAT